MICRYLDTWARTNGSFIFVNDTKVSGILSEFQKKMKKSEKIQSILFIKCFLFPKCLRTEYWWNNFNEMTDDDTTNGAHISRVFVCFFFLTISYCCVLFCFGLVFLIRLKACAIHESFAYNWAWNISVYMKKMEAIANQILWLMTKSNGMNS